MATDKTNPQESASVSPFHQGEQELQSRTGKREVMESYGRRAIRSFMPEQHRAFFSQLPFMVVGSVDCHGWPWASILPGRPGFVSSPSATVLHIDGAINPNDPLASNVQRKNAPLGLLGIELNTRRRNRLNGRVLNSVKSRIEVGVDQSFGNCPKYIQQRNIEFIREPSSPIRDNLTKQDTSFTDISSALATMISQSDTFFVSSFVQGNERPEIEGVDISHRGGRAGFVKVAGNTLTIPDYAGNFHFNTLGNFLLNPKAGLVFVDFSKGDVYMLTGRVEIMWDLDEELSAFKGAERGWRFTLEQGITLIDSLPFRCQLNEFSPYSLKTGNWQAAIETLENSKG